MTVAESKWNRGVKYERTKFVPPDGTPNLEKIFAEAWEQENAERDRVQGHFYENGRQTHRITRRDRMIVATIIQWLATNVGFCFLHKTLKKAGYELKPILRI